MKTRSLTKYGIVAAPRAKKKFVAIVGPRKAGKSTVIQSASGCPTHSYNGPILDFSVGHSIYVCAASPQETGLSIAEFNRMLMAVLNRPAMQGVIIAVQPTAPTRRMSMDYMFTRARLSGFETYAFVLDPPHVSSRRGVPPFRDIRERIEQVDSNARVVRLDGRRFAILNAESIRAVSRMPF